MNCFCLYNAIDGFWFDARVFFSKNFFLWGLFYAIMINFAVRKQLTL